MTQPPIVTLENLARVWDQEVGAWIARAVARGQGDENLTDVLVALAQGRYALWHEPGRYAAVFQVMKLPRQTVATVLYCGGSDLKAMVSAFDFAQSWTRANGVEVLRVYGRRGWGRLLKLERGGAIWQKRLA